MLIVSSASPPAGRVLEKAQIYRSLVWPSGRTVLFLGILNAKVSQSGGAHYISTRGLMAYAIH